MPQPATQRRLRSMLSIGFFLLVAAVLVYAARKIEWHEVLRALVAIPVWRLLLAAALASLSYAGYACTDLFASPQLRGKVSRPLSMVIAFVSYAFNQSFGSLLGTIGFRFRLYARYEVGAAAIARVVGMSFVTNWSGYCLLAGIAFSFSSLHLPAHWRIGESGLRIAGAVLLFAAVAYPVLCLLFEKMASPPRIGPLELPGWRTAAGQLGLSSAIWLSIAGTVYILLKVHSEPLTVLTVFLLASVAGLITHVPGGLGVIEAVFIALLGSLHPRNELLASLIAYRVVYYLWPLLPAALLYLWLEWTAPARQHRRP